MGLFSNTSYYMTVICHHKNEYALSSMWERLCPQDEAVEALRTGTLHISNGEPRLAREILHGKIARTQIRHTQSITIKD